MLKNRDQYARCWKTEGFEAFRRGTFGNGGHNLYVSRAGILQRIYQFDLTGNGFIDLVFCNSQSHWEKPDALIYDDPLGEATRSGVRCHGCRAATVADLNGDGYDDLVLGSFKDGLATELNAMVYYGSPEGLTENYHIELPASQCTGVAAGDFNGNGRVDLAFLTRGKVRIFYQTELGFEIKRYVDLDLEGQQIEASDLDADGYADLLVRSPDGTISVWWGGEDGIQSKRFSIVASPLTEDATDGEADLEDSVSAEEFVADADPLVRAVSLEGTTCVFCAQRGKALLIPVNADRTSGTPLEFAVRNAYAVAVGDINGNGRQDLLFAARDRQEGKECSWIYWGTSDGFSEDRRESLPSVRACDASTGDLNGNGCADVLITQNRDLESFTTESVIYRGIPDGFLPEPVRVESHDARRGFIARTGVDGHPQVILTSNFARSASDELPNYLYFGSESGYSPEDRQEIAGWGSYTVLYADLDDNGLADLVSANGAEFSDAKDPGSFIFYNCNSGIGSAPSQVLPTRAATIAQCADLDRNGYLDLIFCGFRAAEVIIFHGGPDGFDPDRKTVIPLELDGEPYGFLFSLCLVDLTGNGWLDLVLGGGNAERVLILWGGPEGFSLDRSRALAAFIPRTITAADLNGNGYPDLIIGARKPQLDGPHDAFLNIYWNGPEGLREDRKTVFPVKSTNGLAVADFNNDGCLDIFTGSYTDGRERDLESYIYWNRPGRGFSLLDRQCLQTHAVGGCLAADLNENGHVDLVVTNHKVLGNHKGYSEVWWNGPGGFNVERTTELPTIGGRGPSVINPGSILDRGPEEVYISEPYQLPDGATLTGLSWAADTPAKTWIRGQVRIANSLAGLEAARWIGPGGEDS
jgi:hypothetical protein